MSESQKRSNSNLVRGILAGVLALYLCFGLLISDHLYAGEKVGRVEVLINSTENNKFVTPENILAELETVPTDSDFVKDVSLSEIERSLRSFVNIEDASVNRTVNGNIKIKVTPMIPVARVFDSEGKSYYINASGKKLKADIRHHVDVPIITGHVDDSVISAADLLPIIRYVNSDTLLNSLTSAFKIDRNHDVILIPMIKGHVVNLGYYADTNIEDKFNRLLTMYREVLPIKGWQYYDTLSVKFDGQVVATRARKSKPVPMLLHELEDYEEVDLSNTDTSIDQ